MTDYDFRRATIVGPWFPEDSAHTVRLLDGTVLPALMLDLDSRMFEAGDPVAVVIRRDMPRRAFILGAYR